MKNNISKFNKCANCGACVNACPVDAITIDLTGYYYSVVVDNVKCIECGKCISVCPVNVPQKTQQITAAYAGYIDNESVLRASSSGGAFHAIAKNVLSEKGVVYGATFSEDAHSVVFSSTDEVVLQKLQKSKYVESNIALCFRKIRRQLQEGRKVLFCGTPCQAAGLKRFLGREYSNLIVCDFSCGGLPSHKIFDEYLKMLEKKYKSKVDFIDFRPKNYGWKTYSIFVKFKNEKVYTRLATLDPYYKAFLNSLSKRDYCYHCDFADNHAADIILADFWLYKKLSQIDNQDRGLSLILTNSPKGEEIVRKLKGKMVLESIPLTDAMYNIKSGHLPNKIICTHGQFLKFVEEIGFVNALETMKPSSLMKDWKQWIKQFIKRKKYEGSEDIRD